MSSAVHIVTVPAGALCVEDLLNRELAACRAPFFLAVAPADQIEPEGPGRLAAALRAAPPRTVGAVATVDEVRQDGGLRRVSPAALPDRRALLARQRTPGPPLLRTAALRAAGGWRPGEACWDRRPERHRPLLARLLDQGPILAVNAFLGTVARPAPPGLPFELFLFRRVSVVGRGFRFTGRLAALAPALLTLAGDDGTLTFIRPDRVVALTPAPAPAPGQSR